MISYSLLNVLIIQIVNVLLFSNYIKKKIIVWRKALHTKRQWWEFASSRLSAKRSWYSTSRLHRYINTLCATRIFQNKSDLQRYVREYVQLPRRKNPNNNNRSAYRHYSVSLLLLLLLLLWLWSLRPRTGVSFIIILRLSPACSDFQETAVTVRETRRNRCVRTQWRDGGDGTEKFSFFCTVRVRGSSASVKWFLL